MVDFFFYGTLRDAAVRRIVLGLDIASSNIDPATLPGYRCAPVENGRFPGLVPSSDDVARGMLVRAVPMEAAIRTSFFEGEVADYTVASVTVDLETGPVAPAWVYLPTASLMLSAGYWSLSSWQQTYRLDFIRDAEKRMNQATPEALDAYREGWLDRLSRLPGSG